MRKKLFLILLFIFISTVTVQAELVDRIVAVVNNDIITLSDLETAGHSYFQAIIRKLPTQQQESALNKARKEVLNNLIDQMLIRQQGQEIGIEISKAEIDNAIESIISNNQISKEKFHHDLQLMGTSETKYREKIKDQILNSRIVSFKIRSSIVITDAKIQQYYEQNYSVAPTNSDTYHIMQIGFRWGNNFKAKTKEKALEKAKDVRNKLLSGENFQDLARSLSDLPSAEDGGDIGQFKKDDMAPYMEKTISNMHLGEISEILQTPSGYQILKLKAAPGQEKPKLTDVKDEIKEILFKQEEKKNYQDWLTGLRKKAFIKYSM